MTPESAVRGLSAHVAFRVGTKQDMPFVFSSWLKSYRKARAVRYVAGPVYYQAQHERIAALLARPGCGVVVACAPDNPAELYGYAVVESVGGVAIVHYVYVKHLFRRMGLGARLVALAAAGATGVQHSHSTQAGEALLIRFGSTLNPYLGS